MAIEEGDLIEPTKESLIQIAPSFRPQHLGAIEPELRGPTPRRDYWESCLVDKKVVLTWEAVRGWVVFFHKERKHPEGPDYYVAVAHETANGIKVNRLWVNYDSAHWFIGSNDHYHWFHSTMKVGNSITVLVPPNPATGEDLPNTRDVLYGMTEPKLRLHATDILDFMKMETDPEHIAGAADCFDEMLFSLAREKPALLMTALKVMGKHAADIHGKEPRDFARELSARIKAQGVRTPGLDILADHLKDEYIVRFSAG